ncbi:MAG: hypothetical protein HOY78_08030 [Saccharothrix sp.]|nr:hypothetical protein [Saccharothrix sp.]
MSDTPVRVVGTLADFSEVRSIHELVTDHVAGQVPGRAEIENAYRTAIDRRLAPHGLAVDGRDRVVALRPLPDDLDVTTLVRAALYDADLPGITRHPGIDSNAPLPRHPSDG